jgi:hypothetical protein
MRRDISDINKKLEQELSRIECAAVTLVGAPDSWLNDKERRDMAATILDACEKIQELWVRR